MSGVLWSGLFVAGVAFFSYQIWGRLQVLLKARRDDGRDYTQKTWGLRIKNTLIYGLGQAKFLKKGDQPAGILHIFIFWGFITLGLQVVTMFLRGWFPDLVLPGLHVDQAGKFYAFTKDIFQVLVLISVVIFLVRWALIKPKRLYGILPAEAKLNSKSHAEAYFILSFIGTIMLSSFIYDAGRAILNWQNPQTQAELAWSPFTQLFVKWIGSEDLNRVALLTAIGWWVHNTVIIVFMNLLPRSKHFHIITGMLNVFFGKIEPKGRLPKKDYSVDGAIFGRSQINQFSWKQVLDMYSCTECGRCSAVCPAAATGKPLAPRQFLLNLRDTLYENQSQILAGKSEFDSVVGEGKPVIDDVVWSCVACRACEEACPVNIEYVDKIVDIRQHLVQEASRFPSELNRAFQGLERNSNPWGISSAERFAWAEGLEVPVISENQKAEYLYYVGCGGCFDNNHKKSAQALTKILKEAKVDYAVLGSEETCNGETARRLGNEYLFQSMAETLTEKINNYGVKKIITNCPHCFNTMKNDYPEMGGKWEVHNASEFVNQLVKDGKIQLKPESEKKVVYHDSCYNARFNDVVEQPRELLKSATGKAAVEMDLNKKGAMCCGAGGGRMWMEEQKDQRVNIARTEQALDKKPEVIGTSCPFCRVMLSSGVNEKGLGEQVQVMDVMEIVAQNMKPVSVPS
ncbi:(Fe-S)-binding protein [bacterium]|nr:(Fe-S)-binding protein [bacterium]NBX82020.1 (Fe-S)-binding protein [bacterium]